MATELEITKRRFYSDYHNIYDTGDFAIEDCRFLTFMEFLDETDIFTTPILSRRSGTFKNGNWSILGYCCESYRQLVDDDEMDNEENEELDNSKAAKNNIDFNWEYTLVNGFFSTELEVSKASKQEITKSLNEITRFIEKTFAKDYINDFCEAKNLQEHLLSLYEENKLERLDICIVTDKIIEQELLETKIEIKNADIECKIYYWDLNAWNDLKRSKSKRLPIDIDFKTKNYNFYNLEYLQRNANNRMSYYLSVFPADLIADLYDYHNTRLLENNVRVFLSATRKANKAIRATIKNEPENFFSYNNGISATAQDIIIENSKIIRINDFQIVNGGQTTASIHYARKRDKYSLKDVFVPVKITSLKKDDEYGDIVNNISKAANTQSAIRSSDFYANDSMLVDLERLSNKNPVQNYKDRNVYYFFERMSGQYNVTKNSRGTNRNIRMWEQAHPKDLSFNKIDLARWYNSMEELPHIAALSAEKQFTNFMQQKDFKRKELTLGRFKTLIGYGMLFNRVRKLVGTKNGKEYPSIIEDSSVGMATSIYAMSYLQYKTKGCIDYWGIYNYEYNVSESLLRKKYFESKFDKILVEIIKACWKQLSNFGKFSVQEQTKKLACWEFVKQNIEISDAIFDELRHFKISQKERDLRDSESLNDDDFNYFESLNILLANGANKLFQLNLISNKESAYLSQKNKTSNLIKKIKSSNSILPKKRVESIFNFYTELVSKGFIFNTNDLNSELNIDININKIFDTVFKDKKQFINQYEEFVLQNENDFEQNNLLYEKVRDIQEKYYREYGLSIDDLIILNEVVDKLSIQIRSN